MNDVETGGTAGSRAALAPDGLDHDTAYVRAFELVVAVQTAAPDAKEEIHRLLDQAEAKAWSDVVRAALFAEAVAARTGRSETRLAAVQRLLDQAERDAAPTMIALALAMRSDRETTEEDPRIAVFADDDLARATVLLEGVEGSPMERISAHNACAQAYCDRWLWELGDEQYDRALKLAPEAPTEWVNFVLPAIVYNRAEMQVDWACILRQIGDVSETEERLRTWQAAMSLASTVDMPPHWATELEALGVLLQAIVGVDRRRDASEMLTRLRPEDYPGAWPIGWLHLALALMDQRAGNLEEARREAELAVAEIDPRGSQDPHELALCVAAELEQPQSDTASLRYARHQLLLRWSDRLAGLGSMLGRLETQRLRREHDVMTRQAHLDDLTGLANRRGFARYLEAIEHQGVHSLTLLLADLDDFKSVNDRFGHAVGDAVLVTVGRLLEAYVRQADCAVRLGGDEFAIVLASTSMEVGRRRAEAMVDAVRRQAWSELAPGLSISLSVGLAAGTPAEFPELIERADRALYEAKAGQRGVVISGEASQLAGESAY